MILAFYCLNRFVIKPTVTDTLLGIFVRCHLNDYLGGILFPIYINIWIDLFGDLKHRITALLPSLLVGILCSVFWEGIAPFFLSYSTADWLDCIAYIAGSFTYWCISGVLERQTSFEKRKIYG